LKHARKFKLCLVVALFAATAFAESSLAQQKLPSDWNKVIEAAKREGVVKCACPLRRDFALMSKKDFEDAYPWNNPGDNGGDFAGVSPAGCEGTDS